MAEGGEERQVWVRKPSERQGRDRRGLKGASLGKTTFRKAGEGLKGVERGKSERGNLQKGKRRAEGDGRGKAGEGRKVVKRGKSWREKPSERRGRGEMGLKGESLGEAAFRKPGKRWKGVKRGKSWRKSLQKCR